MKTAQEIIPTHYIKTKNRSTPYPRFKKRWSKLRQLNWKASLIMAEYPGVRLYVMKGRSWRNGIFEYGLFALSYNNGGMSAISYRDMWELLNGVSTGLHIAETIKRHELNERKADGKDIGQAPSGVSL